MLVAAGCSTSDPTSRTPAATFERDTDLVLASLDVASVRAGSSWPRDLTVQLQSKAPPSELQELSGATVLGTGTSVDLGDRSFEGAFLLDLLLPPRPSNDALPGVWYVDDDGNASFKIGTWSPSNGIISVEARAFSDFFAGWWSPDRWAEHATSALDAVAGAADLAVDFSTGRTDPPDCRNDPPDWGRVFQDGFGTLHVCGQTNTGDDGIDRFEVFVKSNRPYTQLLQVPFDIDYLWVEGQPSWYRPVVSWLYSQSFDDIFLGTESYDVSRTVALGPGMSMSFGFLQPAANLNVPVDVSRTDVSILLDGLGQLLGLASGGTLAFGVAMTACVMDLSGVSVTGISPSASVEADSLWNLQIAECAATLMEDERRLQHAGASVASRLNLTASQTRGLSRGIQGASQVAGVALQAVALVTVTTQAGQSVLDAFRAEEITVSLTARPRTENPQALPTEPIDLLSNEQVSLILSGRAIGGGLEVLNEIVIENPAPAEIGQLEPEDCGLIWNVRTKGEARTVIYDFETRSNDVSDHARSVELTVIDFGEPAIAVETHERAKGLLAECAEVSNLEYGTTVQHEPVNLNYQSTLDAFSFTFTKVSPAPATFTTRTWLVVGRRILVANHVPADVYAGHPEAAQVIAVNLAIEAALTDLL